jgi:hypothetical protein
VVKGLGELANGSREGFGDESIMNHPHLAISTLPFYTHDPRFPEQKWVYDGIY